MTDDPIRWTLYDNADFQGLNEDIHDLHLALDAIHNRYAHGWGIAGGLDISGVGSDTLVITSGVALDSGGQTIVLAAHGLGEIGISPPAQSIQVPVPVHLKTSDWPQTTNATLYLTLQYLTYREEANVGPQAKSIQTPWMRLQPAINAAGQVINALVNLGDGTELVLAIVATDAAGIITSLKTSDPALPYGRRIVGQHVGALSFHAPASTGIPLTVGAATHGTLAPGATGGLEIATAGSLTVRNPNQLTGAALRFGPEASAAVLRIENSAPQSLSVLDLSSATQHWQLRVDGTDGQKFKLYDATRVADALVIDTSGHIGMGTQQPDPHARLHVHGGRLRVSESDGANGSGVIELSNGAQTNVMFTADGTGHLHLRTDSGNRHVVLQAGGTQGNVGIGTADPLARLDVNGDLALQGKHAFRGSDPWLRLNQDGAFPAGTHTPGFFNAQSMTVGPLYTNPGAGNLQVSGSLMLNGDLAIQGKHAFRGSDPWLRLNQDGAFPAGTHTPGFFNAQSMTVGPLYSSPGAGNLQISGRLFVNGDLAIQGKHAFRGSDSWLRLNQDGAFPSGTHTPGLFAPNSLNVGNAGGNWGNPGAGKTWFANNVGIGNYSPNTIPGWSGGGLSCWDVIYHGGLHNESTIRVKDNIQPLTDVLRQIDRLNPVRFDRREAPVAQRESMGFIAEEVYEVVPSCVDADDDFFAWGINESHLHALAIAGIQELARKVKLLENRLRHRRRRAPTPQLRSRYSAQSTIDILRERVDSTDTGPVYVTVRFRARHIALGSVETIRTFRLPPDITREDFLQIEWTHWFQTLDGHG